MKIIVIGPRGKMGKLITQVAASRDDMELIAGVVPKGRDYIGTDLGTVAMVGRELGVPVVDDLRKYDACDVIIDFLQKKWEWKFWILLSLTRRGWYAALPVSHRKKWHVLKTLQKRFQCFTPPTHLSSSIL